MPLDLKTKDHKEYLIARSNSGEMYEIRLDKIKQSDVSKVISS
jgi:transcriptional antiterminator Rof (Rho-off)